MDTEQSVYIFHGKGPRQSTADPQILLSHKNKHQSCLLCDFVKMQPERLPVVVVSALSYTGKKEKYEQNFEEGLIGEILAARTVCSAKRTTVEL